MLEALTTLATCGPDLPTSSTNHTEESELFSLSAPTVAVKLIPPYYLNQPSNQVFDQGEAARKVNEHHYPCEKILCRGFFFSPL